MTVKQVGAHAPALLADSGLDLRIAACADSKHMILAAGSDGMEHKAIDAAIGDRAVADWDVAALNADAPTAADLDALVAKLKTNAANTGGAAVVVDNTSSEFVAGKYGDWLGAGVHVVTPNKKANSGDLTRFKNFTKAAADGNAHWFYEGTIGAGLPVVSTLRTLRRGRFCASSARWTPSKARAPWSSPSSTNPTRSPGSRVRITSWRFSR